MTGTVEIRTEEVGFGLYNTATGEALIQGIPDWSAACELHEMFLGEMEGDDDRPG